MSVRILDVDLETFARIPPECQQALFWELPESAAEILDARFQKEEWFSSTLLEWGRCGKVVVDGETSQGFAEFAPATLFPRLGSFAAGSVSDDAAYLSYCYVASGNQRRGLGTELVRTVARDLLDRGYRAVEAVGDREWDGRWVLPVQLLASNGFRVLRDDIRYPLLRLDLREAPLPMSALEMAELPLPLA